MADTPLALFVGMPGLVLEPDEVAFLAEANPYGLFLFKRNVDNPGQVRALAAQFRQAVGRADAPVFIDQEGGRVQRLDNGNWPHYRALGDFGALALIDREAAKTALRLSTRAMGTMLVEMGIDSGTTPVVDLGLAGMHEVIGRRAFGADPDLVATLGRVVVEAMEEVGAIPVIKHIPGYGRVTVDPHFQCPVVDASREDLLASDFRPFMALADAPWAMVAHLVFTEFDPVEPASVSPVLCEVIRKQIGYDGVIITDCLTMEALSGSWPERVTRALDAGYDIALHSQGDLAQSQAAARAARPLSRESLARLARAEARRGKARFDVEALHAEAEAIFSRFGLA